MSLKSASTFLNIDFQVFFVPAIPRERRELDRDRAVDHRPRHRPRSGRGSGGRLQHQEVPRSHRHPPLLGR